MDKKPINQIVADALAYYMGSEWNQTSLAKRSGVAPNTVGNALNPGRRSAGKSGKEPSIKLTELAKLADALGVDVADLVTDGTAADRANARQLRQALLLLRQQVSSPTTATTAPAVKRGKQHAVG